MPSASVTTSYSRPPLMAIVAPATGIPVSASITRPVSCGTASCAVRAAAIRPAATTSPIRVMNGHYHLISGRCRGRLDATIDVYAPMPTLFEKVWHAHSVRRLPTGQTQLFVGLHPVHEVTSPQAFDMLRLRGLGVRRPDRTIATVDHIVPTRSQARPFRDPLAEGMLDALERNCREHGIELLDLASGRQGIVH